MKHLTKEQFKPLFQKASADCAKLVKESDDPITTAMAMIRVAVVGLIPCVGQEEAANIVSSIVDTSLMEGAEIFKIVVAEDENFPTS